MSKVFIIDTNQQLETHLSTLIQQGDITFWHEQKIDSGYDKASAIETHLSQASIILRAYGPTLRTGLFETQSGL